MISFNSVRLKGVFGIFSILSCSKCVARFSKDASVFGSSCALAPSGVGDERGEISFEACGFILLAFLLMIERPYYFLNILTK